MITATGEYLTGLNAAVDVYQSVIVTSTSQKNDISGTWLIHIGTETSTALTHDATTENIHDALNYLTNVGEVEVLRQTSVTSLPGLFIATNGGISMIIRHLSN